MLLRSRRGWWVAVAIGVAALAGATAIVLTSAREGSERTTAESTAIVLRPQLVLSVAVDRPTGVAASADGERIYTAGIGGLTAFDGQGRPVAKWSLPSSAMPLYLALTPDGEVLITGGHRGLYRFTTDGRYLGEMKPVDGGWSPLGVGVDNSGDMLVTDVTRGRHRVLVLDKKGRVKLEFGQEGNGAGEFRFPNAAATYGGRIYVSDGGNGRIQVLDGHGGFLRQVPSEGIPRGLAIDGQGHLFLADRMSHSVSVYQIKGERLERWGFLGGPGTEAGPLSFPTGVALDDRGRIYVADSGNNRILVWEYQ